MTSPANLLMYGWSIARHFDRFGKRSYAVPHGVTGRQCSACIRKGRERERKQKKRDREKELGIVALCTSDSNQRSFTFIPERIERRTAERISHSARCEPRPHRGPIFFFLVDFVCGRARLPAPKRRAHSVPFLSFLSMIAVSFSSLSLFLPFRVSLFLSLYPSVVFSSPLSAQLRILLLTSAEFYDPPRYIYILSK